MNSILLVHKDVVEYDGTNERLIYLRESSIMNP